jgi:glycosyltransferase involved in cell wall biosynthesis
LKISSKFCFFGNISGALQGTTIGGGELQVALLGRALALSGHEVVIIDPYASKSFITPEGIRLINIPNWNKGYRGIRLFIYRIPTLLKLLKEQKADFYYIRMRSFLHIIPYIAAKRNNAKLIQAIAQDMDMNSFREQIQYEFKTNHNLSKLFFVDIPSYLVSNFLLKRSDFVFLQHSGQNSSSRKLRGKVAIFPNIYDNRNSFTGNKSKQNYIIHVGTLTVFKGSENLYQLAKVLDNKIQLIVVGEACDRKSRIIFEKLKEFPNIRMMGKLDHEKTMQLIANADALINTSIYEGFPNIFLESWATGVPVISLSVNPGDVINTYSLGICCDNNLDKMKAIIESDETNSIDRSRLISYVKEFHDFNMAIDRLSCII